MRRDGWFPAGQGADLPAGRAETCNTDHVGPAKRCIEGRNTGVLCPTPSTCPCDRRREGSAALVHFEPCQQPSSSDSKGGSGAAARRRYAGFLSSFLTGSLREVAQTPGCTTRKRDTSGGTPLAARGIYGGRTLGHGRSSSDSVGKCAKVEVQVIGSFRTNSVMVGPPHSGTDYCRGSQVQILSARLEAQVRSNF